MDEEVLKCMMRIWIVQDVNEFSCQCIISVVFYLVMASNGESAPEGNEQEGTSIDPIWTSSRTARQIMALMEVEKVRNERER